MLLVDLQNDTLNAAAAAISGLPNGESFTMSQFDYSNSVVLNRMFYHLTKTNFLGLSVRESLFQACPCSIVLKPQSFIFAG